MTPTKWWTAPRWGKVSLWVDWGDGPRNIWDLPRKAVTDDVLSAIASAYGRGLEAQKSAVAGAMRGYYGSPTWGEEPDVP